MLKIIIRNKKLLIGIIMLSMFIIMGVFATIIMPYPYDKTFVGKPLEPPSKKFLFGTDILGRDVFSRVIYGARISLLVSIVITSICLLIGVPIGLVSGYYGGMVDILVMRVVDILFSFPWVLMGLLIVAIRGPGLETVIITLSLTYFPQFTRVVRSSVMVIKEEDYIKAARLSGESNKDIMLKYILPNCSAPLIVQTSITMSFSILGEAALSYLGYGVRPPMSSWGMMLQQSTNYLWTAKHLIIFPGIFIVFAVLAFNFIGDGLNDILNPRYMRTYGR